MDFITASRDIEQQIIADRRFLHQHAEVGFDLPETRAYVISRLKELGYAPKEISTCIGMPEQTIYTKLRRLREKIKKVVKAE